MVETSPWHAEQVARACRGMRLRQALALAVLVLDWAAECNDVAPLKVDQYELEGAAVYLRQCLENVRRDGPIENAT